MLVPDATPFYYPGGSTGCLIIHGFTGSPKEVQPLGKFLADEGYTTLGIRLFAHATSPGDMNRAHWQDWVASVEDGWHILQGAVDSIVLIGLSMGGALALYNAVHLPVDGVVALSTPYSIMPDPRLPILRYVWRLFPYIGKGEPDWQDPVQIKEHFSYDAYPTRSILELNSLLEEMRCVLHQIKVPTLLMHSKLDRGVPPENMPRIYNDLSLPADKKQQVWLQHSGHVLTRDREKTRVFHTVRQFLNDVENNGQGFQTSMEPDQ